MFDLLGNIIAAPVNFMRRLLSSPISGLIYGLISKWYLITMSLVIVVVYWVIKGLQSAGVLTMAYHIFIDASSQIKGFVQHCTPKIVNIDEFVKCVVDTPAYTGNNEINEFEEAIKQDIEQAEKHPIDHNKVYLLSPYEDDSTTNNDSNNLPAQQAPAQQ